MGIVKKIPSWIIAAVIASVLTTGGSYAYNAATVSGEVNIQEPVSIVGGGTFTFDLYPGQFDVLELEVQNNAPTAMTVMPVAVITPDPGQEVCVELPQSLTLDAGQTVDISADIFATVSAAPGTYTVEITIQR